MSFKDADAGVKILGTSPDAMDAAEDRDRFSRLLTRLAIPSPANSSAYSEEEFLELIEASPAIGFVRKPALSAQAIGTLLQSAGDGEDRRNGTTDS